VRGISKETNQELHRGLLLIFLTESVRNWKENTTGAPERTSAHTPYECKKSERKSTRSSTEGLCLYPLLEVEEISKGIDQELHRGLLLIFLISIRTKPGAPQRTSAYIPDQKCEKSLGKSTRSSTEDFCLYPLLEM
jgi:hypothetical protein